ncbi:MAG: DUF2147 domain-containing protein [Putridiphycobacter sp.]|nr:DUF2147 domain-containing protein [Putridiphycobacter sp.]
MKQFFLATVLFVSSFCFGGQNQEAILGVWLTQLKDAKIQIYKKNNYYYGKVVWMKCPKDEAGRPIIDSKNPNKAMSNRTIMGIDIITKMTFKNNVWSGGEIYDPKSGDSYACKMWLENGQLKVRGYLGWLYDTKTWTRCS